MKEPTKPRAASTDKQKQPAAPPTPEARRERMAQSFADIVGVLMRDPGFRNLRLADLEWLVLPPILSGQWRIARGAATSAIATPDASGAPTKGSLIIPVATALWASVSPAIDKKLTEGVNEPLMLRPNEWTSGKHLWLIAVAGDRRFVPKFVKSLSESEFKGRNMKMRVNGPDGSVTVSTLESVVEQMAAQASK